MRDEMGYGFRRDGAAVAGTTARWPDAVQQPISPHVEDTARAFSPRASSRCWLDEPASTCAPLLTGDEKAKLSRAT